MRQLKNIFYSTFVLLFLFSGCASIQDNLASEGYVVSSTTEIRRDDLEKLGKNAAKDFINYLNTLMGEKIEDKKLDKPIIIDVLPVENDTKQKNIDFNTLAVFFESEIGKLAPRKFFFASNDRAMKPSEDARESDKYNEDSKNEKGNYEVVKITVTMKIAEDPVDKDIKNVQKAQYHIDVSAHNTLDKTKIWTGTFSTKKAKITQDEEDAESAEILALKKQLEEEKIRSEKEKKRLEQAMENEKREAEIIALKKQLEEEKTRGEKERKRLKEEMQQQLERERSSINASQPNDTKTQQPSTSSQSEMIPSLDFLAKQQGVFWLIGLEGGIGERLTPNYNDSAQASFSFRSKVGGGYRWNADYALSAFVSYEATFQDRGIANTKDELETTHSLGFGAMFQFLKYFYASTGALVDVKDLGSEYISRTHENINPFIEFGGILMTDKYIGFSLGLRYVFALGDGKYLNRGISCSAGVLFGI